MGVNAEPQATIFLLFLSLTQGLMGMVLPFGQGAAGSPGSGCVDGKPSSSPDLWFLLSQTQFLTPGRENDTHSAGLAGCCGGPKATGKEAGATRERAQGRGLGGQWVPASLSHWTMYTEGCLGLLRF